MVSMCAQKERGLRACSGQGAAAMGRALLLITALLSQTGLCQQFEKRIWQSPQGGMICYSLFVPTNYSPAKSYPLVLSLHGAGARGFNNNHLGTIQTIFAEPSAQQSQECFVLAPQCPLVTEAFDIAGKDPKSTIGISTYYNFSASADVGAWKRYSIPLGQYRRGAMRYLTFYITGEDPEGNIGPGSMTIRNLTLCTPSEQSSQVVDFRSTPLSRIDGREPAWNSPYTAGSHTVSSDGTALQLTNGSRTMGLKAEYPHSVNESTLLEFEIQVTQVGRWMMIGVDDDEGMVRHTWAAADWDDGNPLTYRMPDQPTFAMRCAFEILDSMRSEFSIDSSRLYVTGFSMGGFGTWDAVMRQPKMFAAAIPLAGGGDGSRAASIKAVPIHSFHGGADAVVKPLWDRNLADSLAKYGAAHTYTEIVGAGHLIEETVFSRSDLLPWLFSKTNTNYSVALARPVSAQKLNATTSLRGTASLLTLNGRLLTNNFLSGNLPCSAAMLIQQGPKQQARPLMMVR
jgi:hypothetical protein